MLILGANKHEEILIQPSEGLDPTLTVAELFAAGPIKIIPLRSHGGTHHDKVGIIAPDILCILRQARLLPAEDDAP